MLNKSPTAIHTVLGIETSCDETAFAIYHSQRGLLSHALYSQVKLHQQYGGVVPELASRDHIRKLTPLLQQSLQQANIKLEQLDGIAYTCGPGLVGALMVGALFGRSLAYALNIPAIGVHHLESHLLVSLLNQPKLDFPFLALLVSGGHTLLAEVNQLGDYTILGDTLDDAAGEAFDKTAKLLDLPYPGGPQIARLAEKGNANHFHFPRPMTDNPGLDFSFSGLKTYTLNVVKQYEPLDIQTKADIARAFQDAIIDTLITKCRRALQQTELKQLIVAGGVSANQALRKQLSQSLDANVFYPPPEFCTDNGVMVAYTGYLRLTTGQRDGLVVNINPRWSIDNL